MINPFLDIINQSLPEPQAGLLNGILFGIKASLPKRFYEALLTTGTVHLIALSGQNISILTGVIAEITLRLGRKISIIVTLAGVIGFVIFVGPTPSLIRAAIMGSMSLLAVYFGRQNWSLLSLVLAAGIMLLINPAWIGDVSFQLSFLASAGIITLGKAYQSKIKTIRQEFIRDLLINLRTTLAAQIFTLPLIWWRFHRLSLIAPLTNVLVGWTVTPIMVMGFGLSLLGWFYLPLGQVAGWLVWVPLTYMIEVIEITAKIPLATISF